METVGFFFVLHSYLKEKQAKKTVGIMRAALHCSDGGDITLILHETNLRQTDIFHCMWKFDALQKKIVLFSGRRDE